MKKKAEPTFAIAFKDKYLDKNYVLNHLKAYNNGTLPDWLEFTKQFLLQWVRYLKNQPKISPNTARNYCSLIKSVLNDYSHKVELPSKTFNEILSLKSIDSIHTYLNNEDINKLILYEPASDRERTVKNQFLLSCFTGMRHSDVIQLDENDIQNELIHFQAQKTSKNITVPSSQIVEQLISERMNEQLFMAQFDDTIKEVCRKAGIKTVVKIVRGGKKYTGEKWQFISSHTARRSFATNLYAATRDINQIRILMGHSSIEQTQRYICATYTNNQAVTDYLSQFKLPNTIPA